MNILNRTAVVRESELFPNSYNVYGFGDSFMDASGGTGDIGKSLALFTSQYARFFEQATGGHYLSVEIKANFDLLFPSLPDYINTIVIQGGINDITDPNNRNTTDLEMQTALASMADVVIADGRYNLVILNITPFLGHSSWTSALQTRLETYNNFVANKYSAYAVDIYSVLSDATEPRQLADWFYQGATADDRTNLHPNGNADRVIDEAISSKLIKRSYTISEPTGNIIPAFRDFSAWTLANSNGILGNAITLADGTTGVANGILPSTSTSTIKRIDRNTSSAIAVSTPIELVVFLRAGERDFAWLQLTKSDGTTLQLYVDLINIKLGGQAGTAAGGDEVWTIEKASYGFVKVKLLVTNSTTGAAAFNVNIRPSNTISSLGTTASPRTLDQYPVEIFVDAVSVRAV